MHALVLPILLGVRRPNAFELDAEPKPVRGELRQIRQTRRRERDAVVGADGLGQAIPMKNLLARLARRRIGDRRHRFASKDETAALVGQRQRVAQRAVAKPELTFVVDAPHVVRRECLAQRRRLRRNARTLRPRLYQALAD